MHYVVVLNWHTGILEMLMNESQHRYNRDHVRYKKYYVVLTDL